MMTLLARLIDWFFPAPAPTSRHRLPRATCEHCGRYVAVIASTGLLWKHKCRELPSERRDSIIDPRD
jgi:hypothetical protein